MTGSVPSFGNQISTATVVPITIGTIGALILLMGVFHTVWPRKAFTFYKHLANRIQGFTFLRLWFRTPAALRAWGVMQIAGGILLVLTAATTR